MPVLKIPNCRVEDSIFSGTSYNEASNYFLDLRVVNTSGVAPVVVTVPGGSTQKIVQGLRPGTTYSVTLKVFKFYYVLCQDTKTAITVPGTSQITFSKAISSTAIQVEWAQVTTAKYYFLLVNSSETGQRYNFTFTGLSALVRNLQPSTAYSFYVDTVNAAGTGGRSRVRTISTLVQPPGGIRAVQTGSRTARISWESVERVLLYEVVIADVSDPRNVPVQMSVSSTTLDVQNILPCSSYQISVSSINTFLEPGEANKYTYTTNKLNPVTSVSVDYSCANSSALVSWGAVFEADNYRAKARGSNGSLVLCTSQGTSCRLEGVPCGQNYEVQVTAISGNCESVASNNASAYFHTVPCPPSNVTLFRECSSNVIIFSWKPTNNTGIYRARGESKGLEDLHCLTTETSCFFTNTVCGHLYTFTVYAAVSASGNCRSAESYSVSVRTAPCQPQNLRTAAACNSNVLTSTWDMADGAVSYVVEAFGNKNSISDYNCSSSTTSCAMPGVTCGESLTTYITAFDNECPSERNLGEVAETVPCVPKNVSAVFECGSDSITLRWDFAPGAIFYMGTAMDGSGVEHTCKPTLKTHCVIQGLRCSTAYNASLIASNGECNTSRSEVVSVETAPCPPENIYAQLDCASNHALVKWASRADVFSYTASLVDQSGALLSCSTTNNQCRVTDLRCGQVYDVSVTHHDGVCPSMPSKAFQMNSVPCGPENVHTQMNCGTGVLTVSWDATEGAEAYIVVVAYDDGERLQINTTKPQTTVESLSCGGSYTVEVMSYNGSCLSMPSQSVLVREVPCVPTNVTAQRTCGESAVTVMWRASKGALYYTAVAMGDSGHRSECRSNGTQCDISDLECGQVYNVTVMAEDNSCPSLPSDEVILRAVPCAPTGVRAQVSCDDNDATLSWDASPNAVGYTGTAVGMDGHRVPCDAVTAGCQLGALLCGQMYTFTVFATDGSCESPNSTEYRFETAPCAPESMETSLSCDTNALEVSWALGGAGLLYNATVSAGGVTGLSCSSSSSSCVVDGLDCGRNYTVTVTAANSYCTGPVSAPQMVQTAPCVPEDVSVDLECSTNALHASWSPPAGVLSYSGLLYGDKGLCETCSTSTPSCSFSNLTCAHTYMLRVVTHNNQCNSSVSQEVTVTTAPCDPENVTVELQCTLGAVSVKWEASAGASDYTVLAHSQDTPYMASCRTNATSCELSELTCGKIFNITVLAGHKTCNSSTRASASVLTAPCPPVMAAPELNCSTDQVRVSWEQDDDAVRGVMVTAFSEVLGGHEHSCQASSGKQSCDLTDLHCGLRYTVRGTAMGVDCDSTPSRPFNLTMAPCTPAMVEVDYTCGTSMAVLSWDESLGRESFTAHVQSGDHTDACYTTETHCSLTTLRCGSLYNVTVAAVARPCNSSEVTTQLQTAPCAPQNVSASLVCAYTSAQVSWVGTPGAVGYNVTAQGRDGDARHCHSSDTSCHLRNMHCAQTYDITVTPFSETCAGFHSTTLTFVTGPCPPTDVSVSLECEGNVGTVTWVAVETADSYIAMATGQDGHNHTCDSNGTSCSFTDLHCGESYAVTVVTLERGCQSEPSQPVTLRTALCPPSNLNGQASCSTNDLTITWDPILVSGVSYILEHWPNVSISLTDTSHVMTGLTCGTALTFQVFARDSLCTSVPSSSLNISTAPCAPTNVSARATCGTSRGIISWNRGAGALSYTAEAVGTHGHRVSCTTNGTSCALPLDCGHQYTATVVSSTGACNSSAGASVQFDSAPCLPSGVQADLDCAANTLAVQWLASEDDPDSYTALAIGSNGTRSSCNTSSTACTIGGLRCGHTYGIVVTMSMVDCGVIEDSDFQVQTAPCRPQNPSVDLDCGTNVAVVTWDSSGGQQDHVVTAVNFYSQRITCNSSHPNCTFSGLSCGEEYTLSVVGNTPHCASQPSDTVSLNAAPCIPTMVEASLDCNTGITTVTWDSARGARGYTVHAMSSGGHNATCNNDDSHCAFSQSDLSCGQDYSIMVEAHHDNCVSLASHPINISTGPCPLSNLQAVLNCSDNSADISWTRGNGTLLYNASAEGFNVDHRVSCTTPNTSCTARGLECGHRYRVSVWGEGRTCPSPAREWVALNTAPCPPTDVNVVSSCDSDTAAVSWTASRGSLSYMAVADGNLGHRVSCNTTGTACDIGGLSCGQTYEVYVVGVDEDCQSARSDVSIVQTAPCMPEDVQTQLECETGLLNITWLQRGEARDYHATLTSSEGNVTACASDKPACVIPSLPCGLTYSLLVVAHNDHCNSSLSPVQEITAAPCPPETVNAEVDCASGVVRVTWEPSVAGVWYTAVAADNCTADQYVMCHANNTGCDLATLSCGKEYNITVVPSRDWCVGAYYPIQHIRTAPCVPQLLEVEMDCLSDSAWVMWEESLGAEVYTAEATDSEGQSFTCNSTSSQCAVQGLECSRHYNFTVMATDSQCDSALSNQVESETAPCPPEAVQVWVDCHNQSVDVEWAESVGALNYTATLERTSGELTCCHADTSACRFAELPCGEMYVLTVTAQGRTCYSSQSMPTIVRTVPCTPETLEASMRCSDHVAVLSWSLSSGGQMFQVEAASASGNTAGCATHEGQCELSGLLCGQVYNATVVAQDSTCTSPPSQSVNIRTVPCMPQNVSLEMDCSANSLSVMWEESAGSDSYTANLTDSNGRSTTCQVTTSDPLDIYSAGMNSCNVSSLACGQVYHVSVTASDGYCDSHPTDITHTYSAPCLPRHIQSVMDCESNTALLSWQQSAGAESYSAVAQGSMGQVVECQTSDTNCELGSLTCGDSFSVTVHAHGPTCSSHATMIGQLVTGPCVPPYVSAQYSLSIGQLFWDLSRGATSYLAQAATEEGLMQSCLTNDTSCALYSMSCSQTYNITVTARNNVCEDLATSEPVLLETEPCPPGNVQVRMDCASGSGVVSWEQSTGAVGYKAFLDGRSGHSLSCLTADTSCSVPGLQCGTVYYTRVRALGEALNSSDSTTVLLTSAPCPLVLTSVVAEVDCENDTVEISWDWPDGADSYEVEAVSDDGYRAACMAEDNHCQMTELECGQTYTLNLTTINENCHVTQTTDITFQTRPCTPQHMNVDLQCGSQAAILTWEQQGDVELYVACTTLSPGGPEVYCNSTGSSCLFSDLECGSSYTFTVTAHGSTCTSSASSAMEIVTEPCQPDHVTAEIMSCDNDTVALTWMAARGALTYSVTANGDLGYVNTFLTNDTELYADLTCGQTFIFTVVAHDERCDSPPSYSSPVKNPPCVPRHIETYVECEDSLGSVSWTESDGSDFYTAIAVGLDGHTHTCHSNGSTCSWDDLHCGESYVVQVVANDETCTSQPSDSTTIHMAPCIPQGLMAQLDCSLRVGSLTWDPSETAETYVVNAEAADGHTVALSTNNTRASISEFHCGQEYYLTVSAVGPNCTSRPSMPAQLQTEPCPPTMVTSFMDCVSNIAVVSWAEGVGAEYYTAVMEGPDGIAGSCLSSSTSCGLSKLLCGESYTVTVTAANRQCNSMPSAVRHLNAVPCVPLNVSVEMDCGNGDAMVSWSSTQGAVLYRAFAQSIRGEASICESSEPHCALENLTCGVPYQVQVVSVGDNCTSLPSQAAEFQTVPCAPEITATILDCFTHSALLEWAYAEGAQAYSALAQSANGHNSSCSTNYTNCELAGLACGQVYSFTVVASDVQCSGRASLSVDTPSVPCPPMAVVSSLDCDSNTALVEWGASGGAESYMVKAIGWEGHVTGCNTTDLECVVPDLMCGYTYNISVVAIGNECNVSESDISLLQSVPCVPERLEGNVDCESGAVSVSWEPSNEATSYTAMAEGAAGYASVCNSSTTTCVFSDLLCGLTYSISVLATDSTCSSPYSSSIQMDTVPCQPQNVSAHVECFSGGGIVSWQQGEDLSSYRVQAAGPDGHRIQCHSNDTSCRLPSLLHCGQRYNLTVSAQDSQCSSPDTYLTLQSVPCEPTNLQASLLCESNTAAVTWERASGAMGYQAEGIATDGHQVSCNASLTHCDLQDLHCGQTYIVSVFAQNRECNSQERVDTQVKTAPCPPQNVSVHSQCEDGSILVTWEANPDAESFHVTATPNSGPSLSCDSMDTSCSISGLPCGHSYAVTVTAVRDGCTSEDSETVQVSTAPCIPQSFHGSLDCVSNSVWVGWDSALGAESYTALAVREGGANSSCTSDDDTCGVPDLDCGALYTFSVTATNEYCSSTASTTFQIETAPCPLTEISTETECHSNVIDVRWEMTEGMAFYLATAEGHDKSLLMCNSTSTSCQLHGARCGMQYTVIISTSSDKCSSLRSPPRKIHTAPCAPTGLSAQEACEQDVVVVSWTPSRVAHSYSLTAVGGDGDVRTCTSSVSNCTLSDLHCGQSYTATVTASGANCTSPPSAPLTFQSVPCEPENVTVDVQCETSSAILSWDASEGAVAYVGCAETDDGDMLYCHTMGTSCSIQGLDCGSFYNFSVQASDGVCNSSFSPPEKQGAVPCPPANIQVRVRRLGVMELVLVSWSAVECPEVEYLVLLSGLIQDDPLAAIEVSSYWTDHTFFEFPLPCGTSYNIQVLTRNAAGTSDPSEAITGTTAPCAPEGFQARGDDSSATLSWDAAVFAEDYTVTGVSDGERVEVCATTALTCDVTGVVLTTLELTARNAVGGSLPTRLTESAQGRRRRDLRESQMMAGLLEIDVLTTPKLQVTSVTGVTLDLEWSPVRGASYYTLIVKEDTSSRPPRKVLTIYDEVATVTDLKPATRYCVVLSAKNSIAQSAYSQPLCITTGVPM
ncbi:uncharacterized protein LOC121678548 [Alosa sapidissima]|uniref:uncharacterized protein LOC121678548 n=1 Tax=Alosa sapidissima TaxID=34773 RepID=UPI001C08A489|nr:uncharacterized protein LOC121678548 [Alosa sapidissima]